jgi:hypothetical protein
MTLYKRIFPYVLAASALIMPSCTCKNTMSVPVKAVVKFVKDTDEYYCDVDGDGFVDSWIQIYHCMPQYSDEAFALRDYIGIDDTIKYSARHNCSSNYCLYTTQVDSVNNRSREDIKKMFKMGRLNQ